MSNEPKDVQFGDPELMNGPIEEATRATGNASCNHLDCDGPCMVIEDLTGDDIIAKQDAEDVQFGDPELMASSKEEKAILQVERTCDCDTCEDELFNKLFEIETRHEAELMRQDENEARKDSQ
jgi:hypothetical protein